MTMPLDPQNETQQIEDLTLIISVQQEIASAELSLEALMTLVCERVQAMSGANGAVVQTIDGNSMLYRACSGSLRPLVGDRIPIGETLAGLSLKTNEVLYCSDAESDSRVDLGTCQRINARSMICVPLRHQDKPIGVLKVVSEKVEAFTDRNIRMLYLLAGLLSASIAHAAEADAKASVLEQLLDSEMKFRTLTETAIDAIIISSENYIIDVNSTALYLFGYSLEQMKQLSILDLVEPSARDAAYQNLLTGSGTVFETLCAKSNGESFYVEGAGRTVMLRNQRVRVTTLRDVTEKHKINEALRESEKLAREAVQIKSEFLANMSHEIRTPINGVIGMTGLLLDTELSPQQRDYTEIIGKSADALLALVNDILDISKIEAKKLTLEAIDFELWQVVNDVRQTLSYLADKKGLEFVCASNGHLPQFVTGDPNRLRQILSNLVNNAIKFTLSGSVRINVRALQTTATNVQLKFSVEDTGIGIPQDAIERMFQPFTQVDASTTRKFGGTGLGLSICRHLTEMMGGQIGVTSEEHKGSTFWFTVTLPLAASAKQKEAPKPLNLKPARPLLVLIAEDSPVNQLIAVKMVEKMGHSVVAVNNGRQAMDAISNGTFDIILMDCQMPEIDGYEATRWLRRQPGPASRIPVIAFTANALDGDADKCIEAGMDDYVSKPTRYDELFEKIENAMKGQSRRPKAA